MNIKYNLACLHQVYIIRIETSAFLGPCNIYLFLFLFLHAKHPSSILSILIENTDVIPQKPSLSSNSFLLREASTESDSPSQKFF